MNVRANFGVPDGGAFDTSMRMVLIAEHRRLVDVIHSKGQVVEVISRNV